MHITGPRAQNSIRAVHKCGHVVELDNVGRSCYYEDCSSHVWVLGCNKATQSCTTMPICHHATLPPPPLRHRCSMPWNPPSAWNKLIAMFLKHGGLALT